MATRNIGSNVYVSVQWWSGGAWGTAIAVADPSTTIEGNARRVNFEDSAETIDVSGISDTERQLLPGRYSGRVTIEKLISVDLLAQQDMGGGIYQLRTGQPIKVQVKPNTGVTWTFVGILQSITFSAEDGPQIESLTVETSYYGYS